ncbi:hypothetical protein KIN20_032630 [Parelaphostrongylus tenuis]|uniref:Uncharacterized protein n=1 Tax=Parelaphostrongylus tenuis TaxID=148309 RepID=A0AAD5WI62_PARTN|nr:hypothetical protein KIN20_032630 [Parelaphostrongylus tenuis]
MRARELLPYVSRVENVVYKQCERDAKSAVALAKCAVRVFDSKSHAEVKVGQAKRIKAKPILTIIAHQKSGHDSIHRSRNDTEKYSMMKTSHSTDGRIDSTYRSQLFPHIVKKQLKLNALPKSKVIQRFLSSKSSMINRSFDSGRGIDQWFERTDSKREKRKVHNGKCLQFLIASLLA